MKINGIRKLYDFISVICDKQFGDDVLKITLFLPKETNEFYAWFNSLLFSGYLQCASVDEVVDLVINSVTIQFQLFLHFHKDHALKISYTKLHFKLYQEHNDLVPSADIDVAMDFDNFKTFTNTYINGDMGDDAMELKNLIATTTSKNFQAFHIKNKNALAKVGGVDDIFAKDWLATCLCKNSTTSHFVKLLQSNVSPSIGEANNYKDLHLILFYPKTYYVYDSTSVNGTYLYGPGLFPTTPFKLMKKSLDNAVYQFSSALFNSKEEILKLVLPLPGLNNLINSNVESSLMLKTFLLKLKNK